MNAPEDASSPFLFDGKTTRSDCPGRGCSSFAKGFQATFIIQSFDAAHGTGREAISFSDPERWSLSWGRKHPPPPLLLSDDEEEGEAQRRRRRTSVKPADKSPISRSGSAQQKNERAPGMPPAKAYWRLLRR